MIPDAFFRFAEKFASFIPRSGYIPEPRVAAHHGEAVVSSAPWVNDKIKYLPQRGYTRGQLAYIQHLVLLYNPFRVG
jgi:hypothetical protein